MFLRQAVDSECENIIKNKDNFNEVNIVLIIIRMTHLKVYMNKIY